MTEKKTRSPGILAGIAKLAGASGLAQLIQVGCSPIITRLYGSEQFGIFSVFLSISGTLIAISCMRYETAVMLPENHSEASGVFWLCVVVLKAMLAVTMDQQECFAYTSDACRSDCDTAHRLAGEVISIPIFPELSTAQQDAVIFNISTWLV